MSVQYSWLIFSNEQFGNKDKKQNLEVCMAFVQTILLLGIYSKEITGKCTMMYIQGCPGSTIYIYNKD